AVSASVKQESWCRHIRREGAHYCATRTEIVINSTISPLRGDSLSTKLQSFSMIPKPEFSFGDGFFAIGCISLSIWDLVSLCLIC
ncbi:unnamed protein product, partial [Heterotrigona itama]